MHMMHAMRLTHLLHMMHLIVTPCVLANRCNTFQHSGGAQVTLAGLKLIVLDEADKLFETGKGFMEQLDKVFSACADCVGLSRCLFSATLPEWVEQVAGSVLQDPVHITVGAKNAASKDVDQTLLFVGRVRLQSNPAIALEPLWRLTRTVAWLARSITAPSLVNAASPAVPNQADIKCRVSNMNCRTDMNCRSKQT
jgi:DEAD/DEAH box helicase